MRRREFITILGGAAATWPVAARAQQAERMWCIVIFTGLAESDPAAQPMVAAFRGALAKLGWTEGSNVLIEYRWARAMPTWGADMRRNWPRLRRTSSCVAAPWP